MKKSALVLLCFVATQLNSCHFSTGGSISADSVGLHISDADEVTLIVAAILNKRCCYMKNIILLQLCLGFSVLWAQTVYGSGRRISNSEFKLLPVGNKLTEIILENAFPNLHFDESLFLTHAGDGSDRIFVVEKGGVVYVFDNSPSVTGADKFLDISAKLSGVGETGLLSLAFHPDFAENKKFYISYCDKDLVSTISEMQVSGNPNQTDPSSERILLQMQQPQRNHNGGHIAFGPDGYLYIAFGDGFSQSAQDGTTNNGDPLENGQNRENWFSCVLRIDVDQKDPGLEYAIPPDNPFVTNDRNWKEEIFAYGFRNPWRFSFDQATGVLWLADVGHKLVEEIDLVKSGKNYGWSLKEGRHCFVDEDATCDSSLWVGLEDPIFEYTRDQGESVTGGYVYRGEVHQDLSGLYVYGDFDFGKVWALEYENGVAANVLSITCPQNVSSFGEDEASEIYVVGYQGSIYRFKDEEPTAVSDQHASLPSEFKLYPAYPNPFNGSTTISYHLQMTALVKLEIYNSLGQKVRTLIHGRQIAGDYHVIWNGQSDEGVDLPSGLYYCSLTAGAQRAADKMLFLK